MKEEEKKGDRLEKLKKLIEEPEILRKEVKVQDTGRQLIIQLPADFVRALSIQKGDIFKIEVPLNNVEDYSIKLKRNKK